MFALLNIVAVMGISFLMRFFKIELFPIRVSFSCIRTAFAELGGILRQVRCVSLGPRGLFGLGRDSAVAGFAILGPQEKLGESLQRGRSVFALCPLVALADCAGQRPCVQAGDHPIRAR